MGTLVLVDEDGVADAPQHGEQRLDFPGVGLPRLQQFGAIFQGTELLVEKALPELRKAGTIIHGKGQGGAPRHSHPRIFQRPQVGVHGLFFHT